MAVTCLNCDGWGCAQCTHERAAARGGEQGPSALELEVAALKSKLDQLATSALVALAGAGIATPAEGYVAAPHCLAWDIAKLIKDRDDLLRAFPEYGSTGNELREERERAKKAEAEVERLTAPIEGLSPGPTYTMADVDVIEAVRGKPYERLRATVRERERLRVLLAACDEALDEFACGACAAPPTADVAAVPEAVGAAMTTLRTRLNEARAEVARLRDDLQRVDDERIHQWGLAEQLKAEVARPTRERDEARAELEAEERQHSVTKDGLISWCARAERAEADAARLREAVILARDWSEPFRNLPSMTQEQFHARMLAALAGEEKS